MLAVGDDAGGVVGMVVSELIAGGESVRGAGTGSCCFRVKVSQAEERSHRLEAIGELTGGD